jgi:hypothetical protein
MSDMAVWLQEQAQEAELREFLKQIIEEEGLRGPALGIAKQVLARGIDSLPPNQSAVFDRYVIPKCGLCGDCDPLSEAGYIYDNGYCSHCEHMLSKDD